MLSPNAASGIAAVFCLFGAGCQALTGDVDVISVPTGPAPALGPTTNGRASPSARSDDRDPVGAGGGSIEGPAFGTPLDDGLSAEAGGRGAASDAGNELDAGLEPLASRPVLAAGAVVPLERVGIAGGLPHLGVCEGGVVIGIRPTANPSEQVFGQRLTLVEPVCATLILDPGSPLDPASHRVRVVSDDQILTWPLTDELAGPPETEVPDPRLVWIAQTPMLCPESAPVLVGLSGEYDPSAPDVPATAAIRSVELDCAPLVVAAGGLQVVASALGRQRITSGDRFAAEGAAEYAAACSDGAVATQILVHVGFWLDGFSLGCSRLASPHLAGEPCSEGVECRSGVCSAATCEP